ncbi:hypothetical protein IW261DRAFT_1489438 [Armillaria novae-zelandiae]|uniref:Transmembrane protein n=1 Tax=Armillaria novae-zelandiae TaxID=153914 RepID=A0AA39U865_9AGAR|nr:hypothetical protein IW261DRAFT_1489438 [Armillaria novae-zelandiae]
MPSFTAMIQDYSPLISYDSHWFSGSSNDNRLDRYSDNSMMVTNVTGASATFRFNGTSVNVYGAKRSNHGSYQVTLDGRTSPAETGFNDTGIYQTLLFSSITLEQSFHELIVTNEGADDRPFLDIDFITWQISIGSVDESLVVNTVQDTDPSFIYSPPSAWSSSPEHSEFYFGSTGHSSVESGSVLTYSFSGEGVSLYGPVGPGYAAFSVQLDDSPSVNSTAIRKSFVPQVLLYHADGLGSGQHVLKMMMQPSDDDQELAVDFANVYTTSSLRSSTSTKSLSMPTGTVVGIAISVSVTFALLCIALYLFLRNRRTASSHATTKDPPFLPSRSNVEPFMSFHSDNADRYHIYTSEKLPVPNI